MNDNIKPKIKFTDIPFQPTSSGPAPYYMSGIFALMKLENGYLVSIIMHTMSHGGPKGLYEMMITDLDEVPVSDFEGFGDNGVKGYLSAIEVEKILNKINDLPPLNVSEDGKVIKLFH